MGRMRRFQLVVVGTTAKLQEADVLRAALATHGIEAFVLEERTSSLLSHMAVAIHPGGVPVAVHRRDVRRAREVLSELPAWPGTSYGAGAAAGEQDDRPTPDQYAQRAYRSALFSAWFPLLSVLTLYYFIKAHRAAAESTVEDPAQFRRRLLVAFFLGILLPIAGLTAILTVNPIAPEPPVP